MYVYRSLHDFLAHVRKVFRVLIPPMPRLVYPVSLVFWDIQDPFQSVLFSEGGINFGTQTWEGNRVGKGVDRPFAYSDQKDPSVETGPVACNHHVKIAEEGVVGRWKEDRPGYLVVEVNRVGVEPSV